MRGSDIGRRQRHSFSKIAEIMDIPNLMEIQKKSYDDFLQKDELQEERKKHGLKAVFSSIFPIYDAGENSFVEFASYSFGEPRYNVVVCQVRDMTFAATIKGTLRIVVRFEHPETRIKKVNGIKEQ